MVGRREHGTLDVIPIGSFKYYNQTNMKEINLKMKISKQTGEHYSWGINCDGWHLVRKEDLSIIHERMPPSAREIRHYHNGSRQFFFILSGKATIEINGLVFELLC